MISRFHISTTRPIQVARAYWGGLYAGLSSFQCEPQAQVSRAGSTSLTTPPRAGAPRYLVERHCRRLRPGPGRLTQKVYWLLGVKWKKRIKRPCQQFSILDRPAWRAAFGGTCYLTSGNHRAQAAAAVVAFRALFSSGTSGAQR